MNNIVYVGRNLLTFSMHRHSHESWELVYCTGGSGKFVFDGSELNYSQGDIVVIPPGISHMNNSDEGFTNIHINIKDAAFPFKNPLSVSDDSDRHVLTSFNDAFYYFNSEIGNKQLIIEAFGNLIVNYVIAFQSTKPLRNVVGAIKSHIMQHCTDCDYELDKYLQTIPFSYDYLRKLFKSEVGMTPHNYLTGLRMQMAEKLLCSTCDIEQNISQIAYVCGFSEPLYFSRVFKKNFGCSPKHYAEKMRKRKSGE
ncbi:MAG: AraC family transcriptional regulator [Bacteroides sp.]|nr:AraC family transcriptional regulator [Bacteroides sp.]